MVGWSYYVYELPDKFHVPNVAVDIFFVLAMDSEPETNVKGRSPVDGPCNKQTPFQTTGAVISTEDNKDQAA